MAPLQTTTVPSKSSEESSGQKKKKQKRGRRVHETCQERVGKNTRTSGAVPTQDKKKQLRLCGAAWGVMGVKRSPLAPHRKTDKKKPPAVTAPRGRSPGVPQPPPPPPRHTTSVHQTHNVPSRAGGHPPPHRTSPPHSRPPRPVAGDPAVRTQGPDQHPQTQNRKMKKNARRWGEGADRDRWGGRHHPPAAARRGVARHGWPSAPLASPPGRHYRPPLWQGRREEAGVAHAVR